MIRPTTSAILLLGLVLAPLGPTVAAEAAVSEGKDRQLKTGTANQGGGTTSSSQRQVRSSIGDAVAAVKLSGSRFQVLSGFLAASTPPSKPRPVNDLDLLISARTDPFGPAIVPQTWQRDNDPMFFWEPPPAGPAEIAGYSVAIDQVPDDTMDTVQTSYNVATRPEGPLTDGVHTFQAKAIALSGLVGEPATFEVWVDTTPPQIVDYAPAPGTLLHTASPVVNATLTDAHSGIGASTITLLINGTAASLQVDVVTGMVTSLGGAWEEGSNLLELRAADLVGNTQTPLIWTITVDTVPPTGSIVINGDAQMTTSIYVTLTLQASDATSQVVRMLLSNEEATGYVEEAFAAQRPLWPLTPIRGSRSVFVRFMDEAGNVSEPVSDDIELALLAPETIITSGPAGFTPEREASFAFMSPEDGCVFSYAFDHEAWSEWGGATTATRNELPYGNHYFRVKAAKEANGIAGLQADEEDPSPAERTWIVGVETPLFALPPGPPVKLWRLD